MISVIALSGKSNTGKDYIATHYLNNNPKYYPVSLAAHFKIWIAGKQEATYDEVFTTKPPHIRSLLQREGTELGRNVYGESVWVNTLFEWIRWWHDSWGIESFCIMDCRFQTEVRDIRDRGGKIYRIHAPERANNNKLTPEQRQHISETDLDSYHNFDGIIYNDPSFTNSITNQLQQLGLIF